MHFSVQSEPLCPSVVCVERETVEIVHLHLAPSRDYLLEWNRPNLLSSAKEKNAATSSKRYDLLLMQAETERKKVLLKEKKFEKEYLDKDINSIEDLGVREVYRKKKNEIIQKNLHTSVGYGGDGYGSSPTFNHGISSGFANFSGGYQGSGNEGGVYRSPFANFSGGYQGAGNEGAEYGPFGSTIAGYGPSGTTRAGYGPSRFGGAAHVESGADETGYGSSGLGGARNEPSGTGGGRYESDDDLPEY